MTLLDWTSNGPNGSAGVLETSTKACVDCRMPTVLLEPITRKPRHKVCAEARLAEKVDEIMGRAA